MQACVALNFQASGGHLQQHGSHAGHEPTNAPTNAPTDQRAIGRQANGLRTGVTMSSSIPKGGTPAICIRSTRRQA